MEKQLKLHQHYSDLYDRRAVEKCRWWEELLVPVVGKAEYIRFQLKDPEVGKDVVVPFAVYEKKANREEYDSKKTLEKLIKTAPADTNWRLMSDGVNYRLRMLEGRLRACERKEDLLRLVEKVTLQ